MDEVSKKLQISSIQSIGFELLLFIVSMICLYKVQTKRQK